MTGPPPERTAPPAPHLAVVAGFALAAGLWRALAGDPVSDAVEARLLDLRFQIRGEIAAPESVTVVGVDEAAVDRLGWAPPPRQAIAEAVERIREAGAAVLALDLLLLDPTPADAALASALRPGDRVILAAALSDAVADHDAPPPPELRAALERSLIPIVVDEGRPEAEAPPRRLLLPRPELAAEAALAHVNIAKSADRVARQAPLSLRIGDEDFLPAMSLEAARRLAGVARGDVALWPGRQVVLGGRAIPTDAAGAVTVNHYGGRGLIRTVSLLDVIDGRAPPEAFSGRAVFIGATAESLRDVFATPFTADAPGVEIIATLTANLLEGSLIRRDAAVGALSALLAVAFAALIFVAARRQGRLGAGSGAVAVWLAAAAAIQLSFSAGRLWLDATAILAALAFATAWMGAERLRRERRAAARMTLERENLSRYVSPFLAEQLASGAFQEADGRTQDAAVLFVDVAGYTALVERQPPETTAAFLGELHRLFERCAAERRGVIANFAGDGAMIVFGLPEPGPEDAAAGLACGAALLEEAAGFASEALPGLRLRLRVSLHFGPVTVAILGGERHAQVTVTGDTVNVASRLQETAKEHGVAFVASRAALDAARRADPTAAARFEKLADVRIRGRAARLEAWAAERG